MIQIPQIEIQPEVVGGHPRHLDFYTVSFSVAVVNRQGLLKLISRRVIDSHDLTALQALVLGEKAGNVQAHLTIQQFALQAYFKVIVLFCRVRLA